MGSTPALNAEIFVLSGVEAGVGMTARTRPSICEGGIGFAVALTLPQGVGPVGALLVRAPRTAERAAFAIFAAPQSATISNQRLYSSTVLRNYKMLWRVLNYQLQLAWL